MHQGSGAKTDAARLLRFKTHPVTGFTCLGVNVDETTEIQVKKVGRGI